MSAMLAASLDAALEAVAAAVRVILAAGDDIRVQRKGTVDLVTEVDHAAEAAAIASLRSNCPGDTIVAEESGTHGGHGGRRWYLDPLDGTTNFAHGIPHVAVSLALEDDGGLAVGVVWDPNRREVFSAVRGGGATLNGSTIGVSDTATLDEAVVGTGFPYDRREDPGHYLSYVERVLATAQGLRRAGSAALDLAWVACGRLDAFWEWKLAPWDMAAGALLVREAGGWIGTVDGESFDLRGTSVAATNARLPTRFRDVLTPREPPT